MTRVQTLCILQARMSSSRLPGKVLMDLGGQPMILFMIKRVLRARLIDKLIVATSVDPSDDILAKTLEDEGVSVFRGSLDDVLGRFANAAAPYAPSVVVRITGDCPLIDADVIDRVIAPVSTGQCGYASNTSPPSYPDGLDCEAFAYDLLLKADKEASLTSEREHVTPFMRNGDMTSEFNIQSSIDMSSLRWTVDYQDDLEAVRSLVAQVAEPLKADRFDFLRMIEGKGAGSDSKRHERNEGYAKSLLSDVERA